MHYTERFVRRCMDFEGMGWHTIFTDTPKVRSLPPVDLAAAFLRDADGRVGGNLRTLFPNAQVHLFPGLPREEEGIHAALHLARCLRSAGCMEQDPGECIETALRRPVIGDGGPGTRMGEKIIFHPGSGGSAKNHRPESWADLIRAIGSREAFRGLLPTLLLGPAEERLGALFEPLLREVKHEVLFSPGPDELPSFLKEGALFLGQDSGVTHLAAMSGLPTVALFRSSSVKMWRPLGPRVKVVEERRERLDVAAVIKEAESCLRMDDGVIIARPQERQ